MLRQFPCLWPHPQRVIAGGLVVKRCCGDSKCTGRTGIDQSATGTRSLALAQFIGSFAGSNMNVMITDMSEDLDTTVQGIQIAITIFLLVMAALMIPGGKLTDRYGRKRLFMLGLIVYGPSVPC